jgi:hypothetical protein
VHRSQKNKNQQLAKSATEPQQQQTSAEKKKKPPVKLGTAIRTRHKQHRTPTDFNPAAIFQNTLPLPTQP